VPSSPSLARAEREALAGLALELGPGAPTLCGDWTVKDLVVHLLVRERNPLAAAGVMLPPLAPVTRRVTRRWARADLPLLVDQLRRPRLTWAAVGPLDRLGNTVELLVHHEDVRRAQHDWEPRPLDDATQDAVWRLVRPFGKVAARKVGAPLVAVDARTGARATIRGGVGPAVVTAAPLEILLFLLGREQVRDLEVTGPDLAVRRLQNATRGY